jgi:hypothetical protein
VYSSLAKSESTSNDQTEFSLGTKFQTKSDNRTDFSRAATAIHDAALGTQKHVVHMHELLRKFDSQKRIFPNGLLGSLKASYERAEQIKRIELFAKEDSKESYGIIRRFFVAYSCERNLLELAHASENVICIRAMNGSKRENTGHSIPDMRKTMIENRLILKRMEENSQQEPYRQKIPDLIVSQHWLEIMELQPGDRIIISNPVENYMVPPPGLETKTDLV